MFVQAQMGAYGQVQKVTDATLKEKFLGFKSQIEEYSGLKFGDSFAPIKYSKQVVAGMNYEIWYDIGNGENARVLIFVPLAYTNDPPQVKSFTKYDSRTVSSGSDSVIVGSSATFLKSASMMALITASTIY